MQYRYTVNIHSDMWLQPQVIDDIGIPLPPILWNAPHKPQVRRVLEPRMARSQVTCFPNMDPLLGPSKASPIPAPGCTLECPLPSHPCSRILALALTVPQTASSCSTGRSRAPPRISLRIICVSLKSGCLLGLEATWMPNCCAFGFEHLTPLL